MSIDSGGSAFPVEGHGNLYPDAGMSLRDYFAAAALPAVIAATYSGKVEFAELVTEIVIAKQAFEFADAMIAARKDSAQDRGAS